MSDYVESSETTDTDEVLVDVYDEAAEETTQVTEAEAKRMGLRQADYTRKTQAIAPLVRLKDLAELDPVAALNAFQQMLVAEGKLQYAEPDDEDDERHPLERQMEAINARLDAADQETRAARLESSMVKAINKHGLEVEADELFDFMVENEIGNAEAAAELLALRGGTNARANAQQTAIAAKRALPPVHTGDTRVPPIPTGKPMTIEEAYQLAVKQLS